MEDVLPSKSPPGHRSWLLYRSGRSCSGHELGHQRFLQAGWNGIKSHGPAWHRTAGAAAEGCEPAGRSDCRGMSFAPIARKTVVRRGLEAAFPPGQAVHFLKVDVGSDHERHDRKSGLTELRPWIDCVFGGSCGRRAHCQTGCIRTPPPRRRLCACLFRRFQPLLPFSGRAASEERLQTPPNASDDFVTAEKKLENELSGSGPSLTRLRHQSGKWSGFTASCWNSRTRP